jgi:hypothetical protein
LRIRKDVGIVKSGLGSFRKSGLGGSPTGTASITFAPK